MAYFKNIPKLLRFLFFSILLNMLIFTILRVVYFYVFNNPHDPIPNSILTQSFYIGFKFDLRLSLLLHLPIFLCGWIRPFSGFASSIGKSLWIGYLSIMNSLLLLVYISDFGYYEYLQTRINATILRFLYDFQDSFQMVWQSYPVIPGTVGFLLMSIVYAFVIGKVLFLIRKTDPTPQGHRWKKSVAIAVFILLYSLGIYGKSSYYPLRWSDAYFSPYSFASDIALNPVLNLIDTFKNQEVDFDLERVKESYPSMGNYLGIEERNSTDLDYSRVVESLDSRGSNPNVVLIILESFAYYKTGVSENPLNPTPHFDSIAKNSLLFSRYYSPHDGTARSVFAAITGIPDIELNKTSSRNPLVVKQHTIINAFRDYEKFYFLGGSASWGEIRGLLSTNIPGLHIYEEGSYSSPRVDVWGISDIDLFSEANEILKQKKEKPFFTIIQTSGNHKPYTIPKNNRGFVSVEADEQEVISHGFRSLAAFNSFRFMDHSIGYFFELAKKEKYFEHTIFVLIGDHGLVRTAIHVNKSEEQLALGDYHVPLVIYQPGLGRQGRTIEKVASEVDLLPTLASMASVPYVNSTFGRSLLDSRFDTNRYAFTIKHKQGPLIGLIGDRFYYLTVVGSPTKRLHEIFSDNPRTNVIDEYPKIADNMDQLCQGIYETAKYIRYHNSADMVIRKVEQRHGPAIAP